MSTAIVYEEKHVEILTNVINHSCLIANEITDPPVLTSINDHLGKMLGSLLAINPQLEVNREIVVPQVDTDPKKNVLCVLFDIINRTSKVIIHRTFEYTEENIAFFDFVSSAIHQIIGDLKRIAHDVIDIRNIKTMTMEVFDSLKDTDHNPSLAF